MTLSTPRTAHGPADRGDDQLLGRRRALGAETAPTSGVSTRTSAGSSPQTMARVSRTRCGAWVDAWKVSRVPSASHRAAADRGSSGIAASRWLISDASTTTSQSGEVEPGDGPGGGRLCLCCAQGRRQSEGQVRARDGMHGVFFPGGVGEGRDRGQGLAVDRDVLGRVGGCHSCLGDHRGHWFARETHRVAGQYRTDHPLVGHRHSR